MKNHVNLTVTLLKEIPELNQTVIDIAERHHEKFDGSGYPNGHTGGNIGIPALMAGIIVVYEALTSNRRHRKKISPVEAIETMRSWDGHFDEVLLEIFSEIIMKKRGK
jgi:HD-GYP domain-containing protein (c-di-GMP phosphodiesterase class II)|tara:strand:+ start:266 stop:589 length:324 start_codon:yes stop_codon:yes gene_type:complete